MTDLPAGRDLDFYVATRVLGMPSGVGDVTVVGDGYLLDESYSQLPHYSTDIAAAWMVVEGLSKRFWPEVGRMDNGTWYCEIVGRGDTPAQVSNGPIAHEIAETAPLAICRAALKAVGV